MYFLYDHLNEGSFRPCYADTDRKSVKKGFLYNIIKHLK